MLINFNTVNLKICQTRKKSLNKTQSSNISKEFTWIVKEGLLIGLVAISFYLLIALLSYSHEDPGFHTYGSHSNEVKNLAGFFGAWISDLSLSSVGYTAYLIPFANPSGIEYFQREVNKILIEWKLFAF